MVNQNHAPEPWKVNKHLELEDAKGRPVCETGLYRFRLKADALRIIACVNACKDISTEALLSKRIQIMSVDVTKETG